MPVTGSVTLDGEPLALGLIQFEPLDQQRGQMRQTGITNGLFALEAKEGLTADQHYKVLITGIRKTGEEYENHNKGPSFDKYESIVPAEYNTRSTLEVVISASKSNLTFDLKSKSEVK